MPTLFLVLASLLATLTVAHGEPIVPAKERAGSLLKYQSLVTQDRRATLEAFTGKPMKNNTVFENLDACTLRQTTEDGASSMRVSKAIAGCVKELGM